MTYYQILNITFQASQDEIKQAYRQMAKKFHPDINRNNPEAEKMFKKVNEAYEVLSDFFKKNDYDKKIPKNQKSDTKKQNPKNEENIDLTKINCTFFGGNSTGKNILTQYFATEQEMLFGAKVLVPIKLRNICDICIGDGKYRKMCVTCKGKGSINEMPCYDCVYGYNIENCITCNGEGVSRYYGKYIVLTIPKNCKPGTNITVFGEGEVAPKKPPGYVRVVILKEQ